MNGPYFTTFLINSPAIDAANAADTSLPERYSIKRDSNSLYKFNEVGVTKVPMNRAWAQLNAEQKKVVKASYEAMAEDDEPPYPIAGTEELLRAAAAAQKRFLASGRLYVVVDVDAAGVANTASVIEAPSPEMGKFIAEAMLLQKYKPALCKGQPCKMQYPLAMDFQVK